MFNRILIIKPSSLGDVATALPLAVDLKRAWPAARIDWLVHPAFVDLVRGHAAIDDVILFDRKRLSGWWYKPPAMQGLRDLVRLLKKPKYDLVIDAQGLFRSGFLGRLTGAARRVGFANAREGATFFYTDKVKLPKEPRVAVVRMRALLEPLGVPTPEPADAQVPVQAAARAKVRGMVGPGTYTVVIPGARWETKRWSEKGYGEVVARLAREGRRVVLAGSPDEKGLCEEIVSVAQRAVGAGPARERVLSVAGTTSLGEMVALLAEAELVVGNDSGPLHVAVALNRPTVSVYGPTDPNFVGPYGQMENVVRHDVACHPCRRRACDHHSCMKGVTVELVWEKVVSNATCGMKNAK